MKTLIVYTSVHHQNTEKVAKVMAEELEADHIHTMNAQLGTLATYDLIGFGSGIYFMKHHKTLLQFVESLPILTQKRAFVFSTSGDGKIKHHAALKEKLVKHGFTIVDEFCCKGWDTVGPLKLFGGINKGRPDEKDLAAARAFAQGLKNKM
jgi:flavodoxin